MSIITRLSMPVMGLIILLSSLVSIAFGSDLGDLTVAPQGSALLCDAAVPPSH